MRVKSNVLGDYPFDLNTQWYVVYCLLCQNSPSNQIPKEQFHAYIRAGRCLLEVIFEQNFAVILTCTPIWNTICCACILKYKLGNANSSQSCGIFFQIIFFLATWWFLHGQSGYNITHPNMNSYLTHYGMSKITYCVHKFMYSPI